MCVCVCVSHMQPQFSSTPAVVMGGNSPLLPAGYLQSAAPPTMGVAGMGVAGVGVGGDRQILGSLASKENTKHQVTCQPLVQCVYYVLTII